MKIIISLAIFCFLLSISFAGEKRIIFDYEYGVFSNNIYLNSDSDVNKRSIDKVPLERKDVIKARLGTKFGIKYWLSRAGYTNEPTLHLLYLLPTMINPSTGKYQDKIEIFQESTKLDYLHTMAFEFAYEYELVPGEYLFYIFFEDQKLLEKKFIIELE